MSEISSIEPAPVTMSFIFRGGEKARIKIGGRVWGEGSAGESRQKGFGQDRRKRFGPGSLEKVYLL
jgi:hypothetical protein